jgi:hypothetical protein
MITPNALVIPEYFAGFAHKPVTTYGTVCERSLKLGSQI